MVKRIIAVLTTIICFLNISSHADYVHRVQKGETLNIIAKNHGITTDMLLGNNQYITNPDNLCKKQILIIPGSNKMAYTIKPGDTLYKISQKFDISTSILADVNKITNIYNLTIGSTIMIPKIYKVQSGDTLYQISYNLGVDLKDLIIENNITDVNNINVGQILLVPSVSRGHEDLKNIENYLSPKANKFAGSFFYKGQPGNRRIALTFDDGPGIKDTKKVLDILKKYNIKATFFILGVNLYGKYDLIKQIVAEGHTIANHTWNHPDISKISDKELEYEVNMLENKLFEITGLRTALIRPPYGMVSETNIKQLNDLGYKTIIWSVDTKDWRDFNENRLLINTVPDIRDGSIILMHDNLPQTVMPNVLPDLIETLLYQGYSFTTVDKLLGINAYK